MHRFPNSKNASCLPHQLARQNDRYGSTRPRFRKKKEKQIKCSIFSFSFVPEKRNR